MFDLQPMWWEWIWCPNILLSVLAVSAVKKNKIKLLQQYMIGVIVLGFGPILYAFIYYFGDVWLYLTEEELDPEDIHMWQVKKSLSCILV